MRASGAVEPGKRLRELEQEIERLRQDKERLQEQLEQWRRKAERLEQENKRLEKELEAARRSIKRQAAPFSKGEPKADPKRPGRKAGAAYGQRACRPVPQRIDQQVAVPAPRRCLRCGGSVRVERAQLGFGLHVSRAGLSRALARMAEKAAPSYEQLIVTARQSMVNRMDETGWRMGATPSGCG